MTKKSLTNKLVYMLDILSHTSLNKLEAPRYGDTCINTTKSELEAKGCKFDHIDEMIPNRFGSESKFRRYYLIFIPEHLQKELDEYRKEKSAQPSKVKAPHSGTK